MSENQARSERKKEKKDTFTIFKISNYKDSAIIITPLIHQAPALNGPNLFTFKPSKHYPVHIFKALQQKVISPSPVGSKKKVGELV
jgi:hypothetical protein